MIAIDHNHVALERHGGRELWVHRKGATTQVLRDKTASKF
jgi:RNA-splicing ligase RtcB